MASSESKHGTTKGRHSEVVHVLNNQQECLVGLLIEAGTDDLAVLCHGFRSSKNGGTVSALADGLVEAGISTFKFDFSGNGESEGQFEYGNYAKEVEDLHSVVEYWRSKGRPVTTIAGHSKGGNVVILYAAKYGDVPKVVNISGRFDTSQGDLRRFGKEKLERLEKDGFLDVEDEKGNVQYRVTWQSVQEKRATDMAAACKSSRGRVLTVHGSDDEVIPVADAHTYASLIGNSSLIILDGANHNYSRHRQQLAQVVADFIAK